MFADWMQQHVTGVAGVLLSLAFVLAAGFLTTRVSKKLGLPNVSGYIVAGILIGPHVLGLVGEQFVMSLDFVSDIALGFIAFGVGKFFKKKALANTGGNVFVVTLFESLTAGVFIALALRFLFATSWAFALLLGAIATATAPASTIMTIRQYRAKGPFVNALLQVVALDDVVALLAFGVASAVVSAGGREGFDLAALLLPILYNVLGVALGVGGAFLLARLLNDRRSKDNRLILLVAVILGLSGVCSLLNVSPLLCCMALGAVYVNKTQDTKLFKQLDNFTPPILSCFFVLSGMRLDLVALKTCGLIGVAYFLIRIIGKYVGAFVGCGVCKTEKPIRNYLGIALVPQAGVSIGLAFLGQRMLPPDVGAQLAAIILSSSILYELIGPACAKMALVLSGAIKKERLEKPPKTAVAADKKLKAKT